MASIAPTFQGFPVSSIRMSAMLFEREQGDGGNTQGQSDELIGASLFFVDKQADQHCSSSREYGKEHSTFAQFRTCTQADEPGRVGRDEAEDGEDGKNELSVQSELLRQNVGDQLKDNEQQKKVKPPGW